MKKNYGKIKKIDAGKNLKFSNDTMKEFSFPTKGIKKININGKI